MDATWWLKVNILNMLNVAFKQGAVWQNKIVIGPNTKLHTDHRLWYLDQIEMYFIKNIQQIRLEEKNYVFR